MSPHKIPHTLSIIGGGIGGLTTAIALQQQGFEAHIYEAAPELRRLGKGIWLPTNALLALERLGLAESIAARGIELSRIELHDLRSGLLQQIDLERVRARLGRTTTSILRAELQAALVAALAPDTLHLGKRCQRVVATNAGATISFDDGTTLETPLLIGADGIHSVVRQAIAAQSERRYAGQTCVLGVADLALPPEQLGIVKEIWGGKQRFGYSAVTARKTYWFAPQRALEGATLPQPLKAGLLRRYRSFPETVTTLIEHTPESDMLQVDLFDLRPLKRWHADRIILVGDAAHAMTPNLGQGGGQAIEDGVALAQILAEAATPEAAFARFEQLRRPKVSRIHTTAWWLGQMAHWSAPWQQWLRNVAFRLTPDTLKQRQAEALYRLEF